jgi:hypothetical protein
MLKNINKFLQHAKFYFDDLLMRDPIHLIAVLGSISFIFIIIISLFTLVFKAQRSRKLSRIVLGFNNGICKIKYWESIPSASILSFYRVPKEIN